MSSRRSTVVAAVLAIATALVPLTAQVKRPDFSGRWTQDVEASKALTEKKGHEWRVAGAGAGSGRGATPPPDAKVLKPVTTIRQSEAEIAIERSYERDVISHDVYKLDGSVSVNASSTSSSRSTTVWKGNALVTTGTRQFDFSSMNARDASGRPLTEITEQFVTTRMLMPDGTMQVESRSTRNGVERVTWSVLVPVKQS
ncbi:MAG TPA: hypothetical protein VFO19_03995 [Vicinamibacterales bacterium]|nr:hypothetical protein [Vicinamibacterales bacterium]